ncbi:hypothetical protein MFLO_04310 [Listeria floridensis FSL S10-1187]|uniref:Uncharacterized protein n=1 Tax=Listeria floridensis FSL S10-1187 TaxID=1265817 RepID=A0ABN0RH10_9LIST|nr:hypothetical protein [Listeria floridensis]EUJ33135.1 hypothetical protein MFLO_04310 [Listeria floridensis FSL S10-1187]
MNTTMRLVESEKLVEVFLQALDRELRNVRRVWAESVASLIVEQGMSLSSLLTYVESLQESFLDSYQERIHLFVNNYFKNKGWREEEEFQGKCKVLLNEALRSRLKELIV